MNIETEHAAECLRTVAVAALEAAPRLPFSQQVRLYMGLAHILKDAAPGEAAKAMETAEFLKAAERAQMEFKDLLAA